jgi:predicted DNA-binding transcriptional regulator AlpA
MHGHSEDLKPKKNRKVDLGDAHSDRGTILRRGLSRTEAARYIGVSPSLFDQMIKDRRMPQSIRINARVVWDRKELDEAFEALKDVPEANPWDDV